MDSWGTPKWGAHMQFQASDAPLWYCSFCTGVVSVSDCLRKLDAGQHMLNGYGAVTSLCLEGEWIGGGWTRLSACSVASRSNLPPITELWHFQLSVKPGTIEMQEHDTSEEYLH
eukprot:1159166-Pelagomonas_calceolata.AAC.8